MPGPSNSKRKKEQQRKKDLKRKTRDASTKLDNTQSTPNIATEREISDINPPVELESDSRPCLQKQHWQQLPHYIESRHTGSHVRDMHEFLNSSYVQLPSLDDPNCARYAKRIILDILKTMLPEELALTLWYNKTRTTARVCPVCQRMYHLGDKISLPMLDNINGEAEPEAHHDYSRLEQYISGICTGMCFIISAYNYGGIIKYIWGRTEAEIDSLTWTILSGPGNGLNDENLGLFMRLTRTKDLGLPPGIF